MMPETMFVYQVSAQQKKIAKHFIRFHAFCRSSQLHQRIIGMN